MFKGNCHFHFYYILCANTEASFPFLLCLLCFKVSYCYIVSDYFPYWLYVGIVEASSGTLFLQLTITILLFTLVSSVLWPPLGTPFFLCSIQYNTYFPYIILIFMLRPPLGGLFFLCSIQYDTYSPYIILSFMLRPPLGAPFFLGSIQYYTYSPYIILSFMLRPPLGAPFFLCSIQYYTYSPYIILSLMLRPPLGTPFFLGSIQYYTYSPYIILSSMLMPPLGGPFFLGSIQYYTYSPYIILSFMLRPPLGPPSSWAPYSTNQTPLIQLYVEASFGDPNVPMLSIVLSLFHSIISVLIPSGQGGGSLLLALSIRTIHIPFNS